VRQARDKAGNRDYHGVRAKGHDGRRNWDRDVVTEHDKGQIWHVRDRLDQIKPHIFNA